MIKNKRLERILIPVFAVPLLGILLYGSSLLIRFTETTEKHKLSYEFNPTSCDISRVGCHIRTTVSNSTDKAITITFLDTGGGPLAQTHYNAELYDDQGHRCYVGPDFQDDPLNIPAHESRFVQLRCISSTKNTLGHFTHLTIYGKRYRLN